MKRKVTLIAVLISLIIFITSILFNESSVKRIHVNDPKLGKKYERLKKGLPKSDRPGEAIKWYFEQRAFPTGVIPADWRERALQHIEKKNLQKNTKSLLNWMSVGPHNIGGRVRAIAISNLNPNVVFASSVSGGIFKSTNAGSSWTPISDFAGNLAISSLVLDPNNNNIIYAGTGEGFFNYDAVRGEGVLKSTDGGNSWTLLKNFSGPTGFPYYINDLYIRPDSTNILYAATNSGLFRTTNSGTSWNFIHSGTSYRATQIVPHPSDPRTFYVCYGNFSTDGIYKTTNAGASFTKLTGGFPTSNFNRISLSISKSNPNILIASLDSVTTHYTHSIQKSTDGGQTWFAVGKPIDTQLGGSHLGGQGWYNNVIAIHPTNPDIIFAGGVNLFRSTNGGTTWSMIAFGYPPSPYPYVHVDHHAIVFHPTDPSTIYFGTDGGVFKTTNTGSTFSELNNGFSTTQFYSGAVHPTSEIYYGGTQDNGTLKSGILPNWSMVFGGDGGATAVDYNNPNIVYTEYVNLNIQKSTNAGLSWFKAMNGIPSGPSQYDGTTDRVLFIAPFVMDPNSPTTLVAGTYQIYRTTNGAASWTAISGDLTGDGTGSTGSKISAIAIAKKSSAVIYVGTTGSSTSPSRISVTTNSGSSWSTISKSPLPNRWVTCIAIDTSDFNRVLVSYSGYNANTPSTPGHIFLTTNRGSSWVDVSGDLPDIPVNSIIMNPSNPNHWIAGTDLGIFETQNAGINWTQQNIGMANVVVADIDLRKDNHLFVATHGRGMFKSTQPLAVLVPKDTIFPGDANVDGIVDSRDVLPIARNIGLTGSPRINASLDWKPQTLSGPFNPIEAAHADCNGNGIVEASDIVAVIQNWYSTKNPLYRPQIDPLQACEELLDNIDPNSNSFEIISIRNEILKYRSNILGLPDNFTLEQNYPNPFNLNTKICFITPIEIKVLSLTIYDINGNIVKVFQKRDLLPGKVIFEWDGTNQKQQRVSSGIYFYKVSFNSINLSKKMVLIR